MSKYRRINIPIHRAVIAWQPAFMEPSKHYVAPGQMCVLELFDPRERYFMMTDGACYQEYWQSQSADLLIGDLVKLKKVLVREFGIKAWRVEGMLRRIREFREFRVAQRRSQDERKRRKRQSRARTH